MTTTYRLHWTDGLTEYVSVLDTTTITPSVLASYERSGLTLTRIVQVPA